MRSKFLYTFCAILFLCAAIPKLQAQTVVNENIRYNIKIDNDSVLIIKARSSQISYAEIRRGFPDMEFVEKIDFAHSKKHKLNHLNLTEDIYVIVFKRADGKALAVETIKLEEK